MREWLSMACSSSTGGESKVYKNAGSAIRDCLASLAPFLIEPDNEDAERERDLLLLSDKLICPKRN